MVMLVIGVYWLCRNYYQKQVGINFAVDRPLDMCRTIVNVTGDAAVSMLVAKSLGKLGDPKPKDWDDNYDEVKG